MEIKGTIVKVLPIQSGEGKNGAWKKQEFVIEIPGEYPKNICIAIWGDKISLPNIGSKITAQIDFESREYNGRWYTEVKAWKIESENKVYKSSPGATNQSIQTQNPIDLGSDYDSENLPF